LTFQITESETEDKELDVLLQKKKRQYSQTMTL